MGQLLEPVNISKISEHRARNDGLTFTVKATAIVAAKKKNSLKGIIHPSQLH